MNALLMESLFDLWELGGSELAAQGANGIRRQLIIDLETSGLTPETGDIIRFRAVNRFDPDDDFDEPVKPSRPLSAEAERITGTTNERLAQCRSVDAALPDFLDFIDGAELLGDNLEFDLMFLDAAASSTVLYNNQHEAWAEQDKQNQAQSESAEIDDLINAAADEIGNAADLAPAA